MTLDPDDLAALRALVREEVRAAFGLPVELAASAARGQRSDGVPWVSTTHAARLLEVDRRSIVRWLRSGLLKGERMGRSWRVARSSIDAVRRGREAVSQLPQMPQPRASSGRGSAP